MAPLWLYSLLISFTRGAQSVSGFKAALAAQQQALISGSMIMASTENCTKYLPSDEDCREAGKITFSLCLKNTAISACAQDSGNCWALQNSTAGVSWQRAEKMEPSLSQVQQNPCDRWF